MISLSDFFTIPPSDSLGRGQRPRANPRRDLTFRTDTTAHNNLPNREISCPQEGKWRVRLQGSWTVRCQPSSFPLPQVPVDDRSVLQSRYRASKLLIPA